MSPSTVNYGPSIFMGLVAAVLALVVTKLSGGSTVAAIIAAVVFAVVIFGVTLVFALRGR